MLEYALRQRSGITLNMLICLSLYAVRVGRLHGLISGDEGSDSGRMYAAYTHTQELLHHICTYLPRRPAISCCIDSRGVPSKSVRMPKAKKHRPIVGFKTKPVHSDIAAHQQPTKRHKKQSQPQSAVAGPPQVQKAVNKNWRCSSIIDQQASEAVGRLLHAAATKSSGATIKSLTLAPHIVHKKPTFAVTCETLKRECSPQAHSTCCRKHGS